MDRLRVAGEERIDQRLDVARSGQLSKLLRLLVDHETAVVLTAMYAKLGEEVDYPMNYHLTGAIRLAHSVERMREFEHVVSMANYQVSISR